MNKTIQILAKICEKYRFEEKLLFVPSYSIGHQIGENLARTGASWINLRTETVTGYAHELLSLDLGREKIRFIDSNERLVIIEKLYQNRDLLLQMSMAALKRFESHPTWKDSMNLAEGFLKQLVESGE